MKSEVIFGVFDEEVNLVTVFMTAQGAKDCIQRLGKETYALGLIPVSPENKRKIRQSR